MLFEEKVSQAIVFVAKELNQPRASFEAKANEMAKELGSEAIELLPRFFHNPPVKPTELEGKFTGLSGWLSACQFAAFELLFQLGEEALPTIRNVAFGPYDWTQGNAIEVLIRFATENIQREQILAELNSEISNIQYEAIHYALAPLLFQAKTNPELFDTLNQITDEEFQEILQEVKEEYQYE